MVEVVMAFASVDKKNLMEMSRFADKSPCWCDGKYVVIVLYMSIG